MWQAVLHDGNLLLQKPAAKAGSWCSFPEHQALQKTSFNQVSVLTLNDCALIAIITNKAFAYSEEILDFV